MTLLKIRAFATAPNGSGISLSLSQVASGQFIRLGITEAAQRALFGGPLNPQKDTFKLSISDDPGKTHLMGIAVSDTQDPDALAIAGAPRGSISVRLTPWCQVPAGKMPASSMAIATAPKIGEVVVKMPQWARPEPRKIGQGKPLME